MHAVPRRPNVNRSASMTSRGILLCCPPTALHNPALADLQTGAVNPGTACRPLLRLGEARNEGNSRPPNLDPSPNTPPHDAQDFRGVLRHRRALGNRGMGHRRTTWASDQERETRANGGTPHEVGGGAQLVRPRAGRRSAEGRPPKGKYAKRRTMTWPHARE